MFEHWQKYLGCAIIASTAIFVAFVRYAYSYWERKGFKSIPNGSYLFGHWKPVILQKTSMADLLVKLYKSTSEPFIGLYGIFKPILLVRDPELVQNIMVKDFSHFTDRGVYCDIKHDPLSGHLFSLPGDKWKNLRRKLSPTFTTGKLRAMFTSINECGQSLQNHLHDVAETGDVIDIRDLSAKYAINIIASVAFGIQVDTIKEPHNDFRRYGQQIFDLNLKNGLRFGLMFTAPKLMRLFGLHLVDSEVEDFIRSMVLKNLKYRETNNFMRKDFFQLLLQLHRMGNVSIDDQFQTVVENRDGEQKLTVDEMCAQTLVFYTAGFETSSSTLSYCMFELARNSEIQKRAQHEIDFVLKKHGGIVSYESMQDMTYLESCIDGWFFRWSFPFFSYFWVFVSSIFMIFQNCSCFDKYQKNSLKKKIFNFQHRNTSKICRFARIKSSMCKGLSNTRHTKYH